MSIHFSATKFIVGALLFISYATIQAAERPTTGTSYTTTDSGKRLVWIKNNTYYEITVKKCLGSPLESGKLVWETANLNPMKKLSLPIWTN